MSERVLLEKSILGGVLVFPKVWDVLALSERLFDDAGCRRIFEVIAGFRARDVVPDVLLVASSLPRESAIVFECHGLAPASVESVGWHVNQLKAIWAKQSLRETASEVLLLADDKPVNELTGFIEGRLESVLASQSGLEITYPGEFLQEYLTVMGTRVPFVKSCWRPLNDLLGGWRDSAFYVVAGRPGMGKTIVLLQAAYELAKAGKHVLYFSLEMPAIQLQHRILAQVCEISYDRIANDDLDVEWDLGLNVKRDLRKEVWAAESKLTNNLGLVCDGLMTPAKIRAFIANASKRRKVDAVFVDYIGLMEDDQAHKSRIDKIASISQQLKRIALTLDIPVVSAAQLNREVENRGKDSKPQLSDLRDSGSIEQDADVVLMIHREHLEGERKTVHGSKFQLLIRKNRHGRMGTVELRAEDEFSRVVEVF